MEAALIGRLLAAAEVAGLVGARITPGRRDQGGALPAVVLHRISGLPDYHLTAASGLEASRVQLDCWAATYGEAKAVAQAIKANLSAARWATQAVRIDAVLIEAERDDSFDEGASALYRTSLDLMVHHATK